MNTNPFIAKLESLFKGAIEIPEGIEIVRPSDRPDLSDFQSNIALAIAKTQRSNPRALAEQIVSKIGENPAFSFKIDGPGFINITLSEAEIEATATSALNAPDLGFQKAKNPLTVMVDYGAPNMGKALHVGHLRGYILGEATKRLSRFMGHKAIGDIHMGDWGRPMGLLIASIREKGIDPDKLAINDLNSLYPAASIRFKEDVDFAARVNEEILKLQNGDEGNLALRRKIVDTTLAGLREIHEVLNIDFDLFLGEMDAIPSAKMLFEKWKKDGTAKEDKGAYIIDVGEEIPFRLTNPLGQFIYETTDIGTIHDRVRDYNPDIIFYHTDIRQDLHFKKVIKAAGQAGISGKAALVPNLHGAILGKDGKPFKTRDGGTLALGDFIKDAIRAAAENAKSPTDALAIAIAAIKFADMINPRESDYIFDADKFLKFEGKTGPYILYTAVRIKSILSKTPAPKNAAVKITNKYDRALAVKLCDFAATIQKAFDMRATNLLAGYIYDLCQTFSAFYHECHISTEQNQEVKDSWLALCSATLSAIETFANIIAIDIPKEM